MAAHKQGSVNYRVVLPLVAGSLPGAMAGVVLLRVMEDSFGISADVFLTRMLGAVLTLAGVALFVRLFMSRWLWKRAQPWEDEAPRGGKFLMLSAVGALLGLLVGLTSVGSGTLFIVMMVALLRMSMRHIVGTDVAHSALLTAGAGLLHLGFGNVDLALAANILIGSVPGVIVGSRMTVRIPERGLRAAVAIALMSVGLKLL